MLKPTMITIGIVALCLAWPLSSLADKNAHARQRQAGAEIHLSDELSGLLTREMLAIEQGMKALVTGIPAGEWETVAEVAQQISDSFIMAQQLTPEQMEELHHALPAGFVDLDRAFHSYAAMLAHAAKMKNADVAGFYHYKLIDACVTCHRRYAQERFPGLADGPGDAHSHQDER